MTSIYHITHIGNLPLIVEQDGLWCDTEMLKRNLNVAGIAHQHIKDRRAKKGVPVAAKGAVADYVPFYFGPRSPMLCAIHHGSVEGYEGGQERVVHLVSKVETAMELDSPWCFTDGQAEMGPTLFFDSWSDKDRVDWSLMEAKWWNDTKEFPDRSRRRKAEFLVHRFFPWIAIESVGVCDETIAGEVEAVLEGAAHRPAIHVRPDWYY